MFLHLYIQRSINVAIMHKADCDVSLCVNVKTANNCYCHPEMNIIIQYD